VFDLSLSELLPLATVALLVLGPERLPGTLRSIGQWIAKARRFMLEMSRRSGIDEVLRAQNLGGGLSGVRAMMRGGKTSTSQPSAYLAPPPPFLFDRSHEYPEEGPDAQGAMPEDLVLLGRPTAASIGSPPCVSSPEQGPYSGCDVPDSTSINGKNPQAPDPVDTAIANASGPGTATSN
jgi:sec-independent protein translocase protein TatB